VTTREPRALRARPGLSDFSPCRCIGTFFASSGLSRRVALSRHSGESDHVGAPTNNPSGLSRFRRPVAGRRPPSPNGERVVKSFRYVLTDPRRSDILRSNPGWRGSNAVRSIETS
jgi:hypothetical protein